MNTKVTCSQLNINRGNKTKIDGCKLRDTRDLYLC